KNNIDAIIFTAGVGENSNNTVKTIINKAKVLNLTIDDNAFNNKYSDYRLVSTSSSQVPVYQVRTDEELMIEQDVKSLAK
ncbi:MAG: acetate/propionate family kinase, partial [Malacoplasma sp.]|nr:acetate/propionate family kinase [Malacoplasma sp.]